MGYKVTKLGNIKTKQIEVRLEDDKTMMVECKELFLKHHPEYIPINKDNPLSRKFMFRKLVRFYLENWEKFGNLYIFCFPFLLCLFLLTGFTGMYSPHEQEIKNCSEFIYCLWNFNSLEHFGQEIKIKVLSVILSTKLIWLR